jgi:DNA repair photolyase
VLFPLAPAPRLVGIARLAAASTRRAAKRRVEYFELPTRQYFSRCRSARVPFDWTLNPYRGCEFGCKYCYARYTHEFMELGDGLSFETRIFVKQWNPSAFRHELERIPHRDWIAIGTATDPYQPAERRFRITRAMLEILARERGRRLSLTTKSDLLRRDIDLLEAIASSNVLHVAVTITTMDEALARLLEPYAPRPALRMAAVAELGARGVPTGVLASPILPGINDSEAMLDELARQAAAAGAASFTGSVVFLKPCTHAVFFPFLEEKFPHLAEGYRRQFGSSAFLRGAYPRLIARRLEAVRRRHGLAAAFPDDLPEGWEPEPQLELAFDPDAPAVDFAMKSTC